ncbi:MAG: hypothetical protein ACI85K_001131 [Hyphomicrobiaceae bacterium]|jgi:hypothetical protein
MQTTPPLRTRIKPLVLAGLSIAMVRFAAEFVAPDLGWYVGVYHLMPLVILIVGAKDAWGPVHWPLVPASMVVMCLIVWGIPNTIAYTTAQFLEWNHGRFYFEGWDSELSRAAPIAEASMDKLGWGMSQGLLTSVGGTIWCTLWGTLLIWLPARLRHRS